MVEMNQFDIEEFFDETKLALNVEEVTLKVVNRLGCPSAFYNKTILLDSKLVNFRTEQDILKIKNAIYHEMIHARNYEKLTEEQVKDIFNSGRSKLRMGYKLLDEAQAYKEANNNYKETESALKSSEKDLEYVFFDHLVKGRFVQCNDEKGRDDLFMAFYDYISLLIMSYLVKGHLKNTVFNEVVEYLLNSANDPLETKSIKDFENTAVETIKIIQRKIPHDKQAIFIGNICIDDYRLQEAGVTK